MSKEKKLIRTIKDLLNNHQHLYNEEELNHLKKELRNLEKSQIHKKFKDMREN